MTDPVILLGTQSNGETLPVQVDAFGRLVAEGLQGLEGPAGPPGPEGPQGPEGPPGPGIELPPDPYEGALLGWLNNQLAWIGSPPVPVPDGVFGPIVSWNAAASYLELQGGVPENVRNGVYVYQCDEKGNYFTEGCNISQVWSNYTTVDNGSVSDKVFGFDGDLTTVTYGPKDGTLTFNVPGGIPDVTKVEIYRANTNNPTNNARVGTSGSFIAFPQETWTTLYEGSGINLTVIQIAGNSSTSPLLSGIKINGKLLLDTNESLYMRVNQRFEDGLIGVPNLDIDFTPGKYLFVPEQRVAPWVLYGNDPTSLIDHLRSS